MVTMIGLAVGIDYTLFILFRYREERRRGHEEARCDRDRRRHGHERRSCSQEGTVIFALMGMFLIPLGDLPQPWRRRGACRHRGTRETLTRVPAILGAAR